MKSPVHRLFKRCIWEVLSCVRCGAEMAEGWLTWRN